MQYCATVGATYRKQQTTLNGGDRGGLWILLLSEVTLFEYNVSTILWLIVCTKIWDKRTMIGLL